MVWFVLWKDCTPLNSASSSWLAVGCLQVAQQEAQRAAFVVERAKQERQQKIVQAEGEAEAAKMISFLMKTNIIALLMISHFVVVPYSGNETFRMSKTFI